MSSSSALLLVLWQRPETADGRPGGSDLSTVPGLHMGLALASASASYLNLGLLWRALRREGVFEAEPGWVAHWARLGVACLAMVAVLWAGLALVAGLGQPARRCAGPAPGRLIAAGGAAFIVVLFACGFRLRHLRAP